MLPIENIETNVGTATVINIDQTTNIDACQDKSAVVESKSVDSVEKKGFQRCLALVKENLDDVESRLATLRANKLKRKREQLEEIEKAFSESLSNPSSSNSFFFHM